MLTAKCLARETALFIFRYQPGSLFPAPSTSHFMLWFNHEPSTSPSRTQQKNGLARTDTLIHRKLRLRSILPQKGERLLYCGHIEAAGEDFFRLACEYDLEGVVAKHKFAPYMPDGETTWLKIRNRSYSQWVGREALFERERERNPDVLGRDACAMACMGAAG